MTKTNSVRPLGRDDRSFILKSWLRENKPASDAPAWQVGMYLDRLEEYKATHARKH